MRESFSMRWLTVLALTMFSLHSAPCAAQPAPAEPAPSTDPVVIAVQETQPTTPAELMRATMILIDNGTPTAARPFVQKLQEAELDDDQIAALHDQFGAAVFLKLALTPDLNPEAQQFTAKVSEAVDRISRDPMRIDGWIEQLSSPERIKRSVAITRLKGGRESSAQRLLGVLGNSDREKEHDAVRAALVSMGSSAAQALAAVIHQGSGEAKVQAIRALGEIGDSEESIHLFAAAYAEGEVEAVRDEARAALKRLGMESLEPKKAAARLYSRAEAALNRPAPFVPGLDGVTLWTWNDETHESAFATVSPAEAAFQNGYQFARGAHRILPDEPAAKRLYEVALLEVTARKGDAEIPEEIANLDPQKLEAALNRRPPPGQGAGAALAARLLGKLGMESLERDAPRSSALARALQHPDPRVRFAAAEAIMELKPTRAYPGGSALIEALSHFVASFGPQRAIVAHPQAQEAARMAGLLAEMGYTTEIATDPRSLLQLATESGEFDLALVDLYFAIPHSGELLSALRRDARTAQLPVGVIIDPDEEIAGVRLARQFPVTTTFMRPQDTTAMDFQVKQFLAAAAPERLGLEEKNRNALTAMAWLAELSKENATKVKGEDATKPRYDLARAASAAARALHNPELSASASEFFAWQRSHEAQRLLVDIASQNTQDLALRQIAARAFGSSVERYGLLLTSGEILKQYDRYNNSEKLDKGTQQLLGAILDTIELRASIAAADESQAPMKDSNGADRAAQ